MLGGGRSGLPWASGVYAQDSLGPDQAFGDWRGRPLDVAHVYTDRTSWAGVTAPDALLDAFAPFPGRLVISNSLWPEGQGSAATCGTGAYDAHWQQFGRTLVAHGRADSVVRPGWEMNGNWFDWSATDPAAFVRCFQHVVAAMRSTDPQVLVDWTINAHGSQTSGGDAFLSYPGDAAVDIVGIDAYDHDPASTTEAAWDAQCNGAAGLCSIIRFARAHGKAFSVGEWGVAASTGGGQDNAFYIQRMYDTFRANADVLSYESYFNNADAGNVRSSIFDPVVNGQSSARYLQLFGK